MQDRKLISKAVINRLPRYYRYLGLLKDQGVEHISSGDFSRMMKVTASQIRQDLNHFGGFGQQGYGYNVDKLYEEIGKILGLDRVYHTIVIGAGRIGQAIGSYEGFSNRGFRMEALFDRDPAKHGDEVGSGIKIYPLSYLKEYLKTHKVDIAAVAIPSEAANAVVPILVEGGVEAIWNFAHTDFDVPDNVIVQSVHLSESLMQLSYKIVHH